MKCLARNESIECDFISSVIREGDGVGINAEPSVSITAQEISEILPIDLGSSIDLGRQSILGKPIKR